MAVAVGGAGWRFALVGQTQGGLVYLNLSASVRRRGSAEPPRPPRGRSPARCTRCAGTRIRRSHPSALTSPKRPAGIVRSRVGFCGELAAPDAVQLIRKFDHVTILTVIVLYLSLAGKQNLPHGSFLESTNAKECWARASSSFRFAITALVRIQGSSGCKSVFP